MTKKCHLRSEWPHIYIIQDNNNKKIIKKYSNNLNLLLHSFSVYFTRFRCSTKVNDAGNHEVGGDYWGHCSEACFNKSDDVPVVLQLQQEMISKGENKPVFTHAICACGLHIAF